MHRGVGDPSDLLQAAGPLGEHLDDLALDQGGVDVHDDQPQPVTQQVGRLHGDVDLVAGRLLGQQQPQPLLVDTGDVQVDRGDGVARHPLDPVDVAADVGDPARHRRDRRSAQRVTEDGDEAATRAATRVVAVALVEGDLHPQRLGLLHQRPLEVLEPAGGVDQHTEDQPPAHHDLLDVDDLDGVLGQGGEETGRHTRAVVTGQGDQQGGRRGGPGRDGAHRSRLARSVGALTTAATPAPRPRRAGPPPRARRAPACGGRSPTPSGRRRRRTARGHRSAGSASPAP